MGFTDLWRYLMGLIFYVFGLLIYPLKGNSKQVSFEQKSNGTIKAAVESNKKSDVATTYTENSVHDIEIRDKVSQRTIRFKYFERTHTRVMASVWVNCYEFKLTSAKKQLSPARVRMKRGEIEHWTIKWLSFVSNKLWIFRMNCLGSTRSHVLIYRRLRSILINKFFVFEFFSDWSSRHSSTTNKIQVCGEKILDFNVILNTIDWRYI